MEDTFSNLDFLQDLPESINIPSQDDIGSDIAPETDLSEQNQITPDQLESTAPTMPDQMAEKQPKSDHTRYGVSSIQQYYHDHIAKPILGPPAPGHTTFTIQLDNQKITGFHHMPEETRSLKELAPLLSQQLKKQAKSLKERDFKKDVKQLKTLPKTIKKSISTINVDTFKNIPKKLRGLFSSE